MGYPDWLQRIVDEQGDLDKKIALNKAFIDKSPRFGQLSERAQVLQKRQLDEQSAYSATLGERIVELTPKG